jgi:hypothetical protein
MKRPDRRDTGLGYLLAPLVLLAGLVGLVALLVVMLYILTPIPLPIWLASGLLVTNGQANGAIVLLVVAAFAFPLVLGWRPWRRK